MKKQLQAIENELIEQFIEDGAESAKFDGTIVYRRREIWASMLDKEEAGLQAMRDAGLGALVKETVNGTSLSAAVREFDRDEDDNPILPDCLKDVVKVSVVTKLGVRG